MATTKQFKPKRGAALQARENNFQLSSAKAPLPPYDALRDANLRQHFESRTIQKYLQSAGWVDKTGKIVDLDKFRSKLNIIEQEFKYAEKTEFWRLKEEDDKRREIQIMRERALADAKRMEKAAKIKEENRIRRGIILAVRNQTGISFGGPVGGSTSRSSFGGSEMGSRDNVRPTPSQAEAGNDQPVQEGGEGNGFFVTQ